METVTVNGIVLSVSQAGEADRRMVILTKEQGRISVFARGASRPKSSLLAVSRPFVTGEFALNPGRDSYSLHSAKIRDYFESLSADYDRLTFGFYFLELAGYFSVEGADETALLNLLYLALKALEKGNIPVPLVRLVYEYRLFVVSGVYPQVFSCAECKKDFTEGFVSPERGNAVHEECKDLHSGLIYMDRSSVYTLQYIITVPLQKLFSFRVSPGVYDTLEKLLAAWKKRYLGRAMKSEMLLPVIEYK